jgi:hypothetical protein
VSEDLVRLAGLLAARDELDAQIARVVGRSARPGDVGEFIAARIFDIELATSATQAGYDGVFRSGPLRGKTVNVKTYGDVLGGIDIGAHPCDCYLVLTGPPRGGAVGVRHHPWRITGVYLFEMAKLMAVLQQRGSRSGSPPACGRPTRRPLASSPRTTGRRCRYRTSRWPCCSCLAVGWRNDGGRRQFSTATRPPRRADQCFTGCCTKDAPPCH